MRIFLIALGLFALAVYLASPAWYLLNIAMHNEAFADAVALAGVAIVLWSAWRHVNGRWLL